MKLDVSIVDYPIGHPAGQGMPKPDYAKTGRLTLVAETNTDAELLDQLNYLIRSEGRTSGGTTSDRLLQLLADARRGTA